MLLMSSRQLPVKLNPQAAASPSQKAQDNPWAKTQGNTQDSLQCQKQPHKRPVSSPVSHPVSSSVSYPVSCPVVLSTCTNLLAHQSRRMLMKKHRLGQIEPLLLRAELLTGQSRPTVMHRRVALETVAASIPTGKLAPASKTTRR